jgi:hypothetical protein
LAAISLAASLGLKVSEIDSSPSASIWRITVLLAGNWRPCFHRCGRSASSAVHNGAVAAAKASARQGAVQRLAVGGGLQQHLLQEGGAVKSRRLG